MIASVIVDILNANVDRVFDYIIPQNAQIERGHRVIVPFGGRQVEGFVIDIKLSSDIEKSRLKEITRTLDDLPPITEENLKLLFYMQKKYHVLLAETLRLFIPPQLRGGRVKEKIEKIGYLNPDKTTEEILSGLNKNAARQIETVKYLAGKKESLSKLNNQFSRDAVNKLIEKGIILTEEIEVGRKPYKNLQSGQEKEIILTDWQTEALNIINKKQPNTFLLFGVTGSGKTEVYLKCIEQALNCGKTAILLVPEIALTPQIMRIFRSRFGDEVALLHSGLSDGERLDEWNRLRRGQAKIAVGARSAIFAPLENLGVIIVDEQHEQTYISENSPRYDAKDIAAFRASYNKCSLIMGSATPLIESYYRAQKGDYSLIEMPRRIGGGEMPKISLVDMRREASAGNNSCFSSLLKGSIERELKSGNQIMLFINRRGYSPMIICSECGYVAKCLSCDAPLNFHKAEDLLKCHYCGGKYQILDKCPKCGCDNIRRSGTGTQKVCDEIKKMFPSARILRMDIDTTQNKEAHLKITQKFADRQADILVGTQMIAKGHDFPAVTLVGVLDADLSLYFSDYRSIERTFSLITQVSGRAGRADKEGEVIVQTRTPSHYVYKLIRNYDYKGFYDREISLRKAAKYPPFAKILRILSISESEEAAREVAKNIYNAVKELSQSHKDKFLYLNAMKAPVARIKNKYRYQVLARVEDDDDKITGFIYDIVDVCRSKNAVSYLEINPSSMY